MFRAFAILSLLPAAAFAQADFGIKAGINVADIVMTNYVNPDVESDLNLKLGIHAGLFVSGEVAERVGLVAELLYSDKGVTGTTNIHLHYITLPLLMRYRLGKRFVSEFGPEPGYLFSAVSKHGNLGGTYNNKLDLSLDAGLILDTPKMVVGLRYCVGLFSVRDPIESNGPSGAEKIKYQNRVLQLSMGYKFYKAD